MKIEILEKRNIFIIQLDGSLTIEHEDVFFKNFEKTINKEPKPTAIIIECLKLDFINSTCLSYFIICMKKAANKEVPLYFTNIRKRVSKIFEVTRLKKFFNIIKWEELKKKYFSEDPDIDKLIS
jgi:anti-sigma B factor antagonist